MERAVHDVDRDIDDRVTAEHAVQHRFFDTLFNRRYVFPRNDAANDLVFDDQSFTAFSGANVYFDVAVLTPAAGLFDQLANTVRTARDRFAIRDLRFARIRVDFEFAEHAVPDNFQMQLSHAGNDRLASIFVGVNAKSRVFLGQTLQGDAHF